MKITFDLEWWDKKIDELSFEEKNILEKRFLDYMIKLLNREEKDYCKKKGLDHKTIRKDYNAYEKMRKAVNNRKVIRNASNILLSFNPMARRFLRK